MIRQMKRYHADDEALAHELLRLFGNTTVGGPRRKGAKATPKPTDTEPESPAKLRFGNISRIAAGMKFAEKKPDAVPGVNDFWAKRAKRKGV